MRVKLLVLFLSFVVNVNAVLLTKNSNVEAVIFPERRATPTIHGEPRPLPKPTMIQNLDVRSPSTEFSEKRPVEYNVFPAAEPATSESRTDADLVDNSTPVSKPVQIVEDPKSISTRASESIPTTFVSESNPGSQQQPLSQPASGSAILYPGDHTKLLSYKYPIYYKDLTHYICSDENSFYGVINQCDHFIECKNHEALEFICPDGLYFNPDANWQEYPCADPADVICKTEIMTTLPPPIAIPEPLPNYICPDENNYYAIYAQCKSFIECKQFSAMKFTCPDNMLFDPEAKWPRYPCNDASVVRCAPYPTPRPDPPTPRPTPPSTPTPRPTPPSTPTPRPTPPSTPTPRPTPPSRPTPRPLPLPTTPATRTPPPRSTPSGKTEWIENDYTCYEENKYYSLPNDCNSFVECKNFVAMKHMCPDGLQFSPLAIWPQYACAKASEVQCLIPDKPIKPVIPEVKPEIIPNYSCAEENKYYPLRRDCESYVECKKNIPYGWKCPDGLHFNIDAKYPNYPCASPSVARCGKVKDDTTAHGCPRQNGYFALQDGDCSRYLICEKGQSQIMQCPAGLVFNDELSSCDWPENVPSCNPNVFQGFSCPAPVLDEHGQPENTISKYRYGTSCKEYIACQRGYPRLLSCNAGLSFDNESKTCIDSRNVVNCA